MSRTITVETELPNSPAEVWKALTTGDAISQWLMPVVDFEPTVGHRFRFTAKPMPGWDGVINCEVLEVDEPSTLAYTWHGTQMRSATTVRWTLTETAAGGTTLLLRHTGFEGLGGVVLSFMHRGGWRKFTGKALPAYLAA